VLLGLGEERGEDSWGEGWGSQSRGGVGVSPMWRRKVRGFEAPSGCRADVMSSE